MQKNKKDFKDYQANKPANKNDWIKYTDPTQKTLSISYAGFEFDDEIIKQFCEQYSGYVKSNKKIKRSYSSCLSV